MENNKALQTTSSFAPQPASPQTAVSLSERYAAVTTIAQAFDLQEAPLAKTQGDVRGSVILHLSALARFLNLRSTLTNEHIEFIADKILTDEYYKWLKPADLKIFFDRIKMGRYGDFFGNLNSISFFQSLDKYMIERNGEIERMHDEENRQRRQDMRGAAKLPYYVDGDGRLQWTEAAKAAALEEQRRKEAVEAETRRKMEAAKAAMEAAE